MDNWNCTSFQRAGKPDRPRLVWHVDGVVLKVRELGDRQNLPLRTNHTPVRYLVSGDYDQRLSHHDALDSDWSSTPAGGMVGNLVSRGDTRICNGVDPGKEFGALSFGTQKPLPALPSLRRRSHRRNRNCHPPRPKSCRSADRGGKWISDDFFADRCT